MPDRIAQVFAAIPNWLAVPFSAMSTLAAIAGAGLMLWSASYGDPTPAYWAGGVFAAAAVFWQVADRTAHGA